MGARGARAAGGRDPQGRLRRRARPPPSDDEYQGLLRRIDEQRRIQRKGRETTATVVAREETDRTFATIPVVMLVFDVEGRTVRFEHVYGFSQPASTTRSATRPVQPVWCDAPSPAPVSPWKYSKNSS